MTVFKCLNAKIAESFINAHAKSLNEMTIVVVTKKF